jgi:hypothetical protein
VSLAKSCHREWTTRLLGIAGLTAAGQKIIDWTLFTCFDETTCPELATFLAQLAMPDEIKNWDPITTEITLEEY